MKSNISSVSSLINVVIVLALCLCRSPVSSLINVVIVLALCLCRSPAFAAFSNSHQNAWSLCRHGRLLPSSLSSPRIPTSIYTSREHAPSISDSAGLNAEEETVGFPVQIHHQGHVASIFVREDEPILQALERQSTFSDNRDHKYSDSGDTSEEVLGSKTSLALSQIPHECRRGNCLTCSSRIVRTNGDAQNILANVDNGLSPTVSSELTKSGYILTCCSYITGPGVVLELDQNDEVWDIVYRRRICNTDSKQLAMEAQARLLRRVDEENVESWKRRMKEKWETER